MGILGLLFRGAREAIQERSAKSDLEQKLGRKVSKEELYSLGSHLDAAGEPPSTPMSFNSTPREASVPFGDAKPPMSKKWILLFAGIFLLIVGVGGVAAFIAMMPQSTYNRLNPFTPKPPAGVYPAEIGNFRLKDQPEYMNYSVGTMGYYFQAYYSAAGAADVKLTVWPGQSPEEARTKFDAKRKELKGYKGYQYAEDSDSRVAAIWVANGSASVNWIDGNDLKQLYGGNQKSVYEAEAALRNLPPAQIVDVKLNPTDTSSNNGGLSVTVLQLLDDYKKDSAAAEKKYKGKTISLSGTVEVSEKDKKGNPMIGFMRPGSTAPKDGMVVCSFDKSQEARVSKVKKGDTVKLQGKVTFNILGTVILENCSVP